MNIRTENYTPWEWKRSRPRKIITPHTLKFLKGTGFIDDQGTNGIVFTQLVHIRTGVFIDPEEQDNITGQDAPIVVEEDQSSDPNKQNKYNMNNPF